MKDVSSPRSARQQASAWRRENGKQQCSELFYDRFLVLFSCRDLKYRRPPKSMFLFRFCPSSHERLSLFSDQKHLNLTFFLCFHVSRSPGISIKCGSVSSFYDGIKIITQINNCVCKQISMKARDQHRNKYSFCWLSALLWGAVTNSSVAGLFIFNYESRHSSFLTGGRNVCSFLTTVASFTLT